MANCQFVRHRCAIRFAYPSDFYIRLEYSTVKAKFCKVRALAGLDAQILRRKIDPVLH